MALLSVPSPHSVQPAFNPSLYPRTYRTSPGSRWVFVALGSIVMLGGLVAAGYLVTHPSAGRLQGRLLGAAICCAFALLGAFLIASMLKSCVILRPDAIEVRDLFSTRSLYRAQIAGRRMLPTQYVSTLALIPRDPGAKKLKISMVYETDSAFHAWFQAIPDLDAEEDAAFKARVASDIDLGVTPAERSARLSRAKKVARYATGIAVLVTFWGFLYPRPYPLVIGILIVLPLIAAVIAQRSKGLYQVEGRRNDPRPSLALLFINPGLILVLRVVRDVHFLHGTAMLLPGLLVGVALTFVAASNDPALHERRWSALVILLFAVVYGCGAIAQTDALLDHSAPQVFRATVLGKSSSSGRGGTTWELRLGEWGPQAARASVPVPYDLWVSVSRGQTVCTFLRPGALKIPWYLVSACPD